MPPDLDVDRIAAAALAVADERGAAAFTMRAVAEALGVTPMALYHHVADKSALVGLVVEAVIKERPLPPPTGDWREDIWQLARWTREITTAHPAVARLRRAHQVWTPSVLPMTEHWFSLWRQSGLELDDALLAGATTSMAIIGLVEEEQLFREMVHPDEGAFAWAPTARLAFRRKADPDADFELVVRSLVDGVHAPARPVTEPSEIGTERLVLRPLGVEDADDMVGVLADERLHEFIGGRPARLDELRDRYRRLAAGSPDEDQVWLNWIARRRSDDRPVGTLQATLTGPRGGDRDGDGRPGTAQVAWVVGVDFQGRGFAAEAARALVGWLQDRGVATVEAHIHPDHRASAAVATRAGLRPTAEEVDGEQVWRISALPVDE